MNSKAIALNALAEIDRIIKDQRYGKLERIQDALQRAQTYIRRRRNNAADKAARKVSVPATV